MKILHLAFFALLTTPLHAALTLAPLFRDGAVLQQGKPVPVWGQATPGEKIKVAFASQTKEATADSSGQWQVALDPLPASATPATMTVTGGDTVTVSDILVGEVWICSGQSNMAWPVERAKDFPQESAAATLPQIRQFKVPLLAADAPASTVGGEWVACSPSTVGQFTATGFFFGRELHKALDVPIGLVNTSYGGTPVESWMSREALASNPAFASVDVRWKKILADYPAQEKIYEERLAQWKTDRETALKAGQTYTRRGPRKPDGPGGRMTPSGLFNAMVHPLLPYAVRGIIWYQGEANATRSSEYAALFSAMITQWRKDFGQGDVPFYFVQLANLERRVDTTGQQWAYQREAQAAALKLPNTGMAVTADIGESDNIHPKNKQEVGRRLALIALALTYEKGGEYAGPVFREATTDGSAMRVRFDHANGLKLLSGTGTFEVAGADRVYYPATATLENDSLAVAAPQVQAPVAVRYAWKNNPVLSIYNAADLPAAPFRSDDWPAPLAGVPGGEEETQ